MNDMLSKWVTGVCLALLFLLAIFLSACGDQEAPKRVRLQARSPQASEAREQGGSAGTPLKFGFDHRLSPKDDVRIYLPFTKYLDRQTGYRFSIKFTEKYEETADNLGRGLIQFAALGPVNCVMAKAKYGANCLAMGLNQDGKPEYRAVIFARQGSPLKNLEDLRGKNFAFGDRFSTQGHIIPRDMLEKKGVTLKNLRGYVFTGSHANTAKAVLNGDYDAGAIQDMLADRLSSEGRIKILAVSRPYPSSLICAARGVDPAISKAVKAALLAMDPKGIHQNFLVDWDRTEMPSGFAAYQENSLGEIEALTARYLGVPSSPPAR